MPGYPIELDLRGRSVLVVGLGRVGCRKAAGLLTAGARVVGVDPKAADGQHLATIPEGVDVRAEPYRAGHLRGVCLAFAAGPPEVNRQVVADAARAGIWVNPAGNGEGEDPHAWTFTVPAVWRDGGVSLTVSTAGASPALASALRDRAAAALGPAAAGLAATLAELRPEVLARVPDPEARRRILADWADPRWLALFEVGGAEAVRAEVRHVLERLAADDK
jgi:precorrin-2 dehydrogenase / sirohydrochlorin ferrochelatase